MKTTLLITGKPGTGKTALIKEALAKTRVKCGGFYTEDIWLAGVRQGFKIVTVDGQEAILAHVSLSSPHRVSKYKVDIQALDEVGVPTLRRAVKEDNLVVIDEIGKMELLSPQFREVLLQAINSGRKILGTITLDPHPFADQIKNHSQVETLVLTRENRQQVLERVLNWLAEK